MGKELNGIHHVHSVAMNKALDSMPELDVIEIVELITNVVKKEVTPFDAAKVLAVKYQKPIETYIDLFIHVELKDILGNSDEKFLNNLSDDEFVDNIFTITKEISNLIIAFCKKDIDEVRFIEGLYKTNLGKISDDMLKALEIDVDEIKQLIDKGPIVGWSMLAFISLSKAYEILSDAKENAKIAHEQRLEIEAKCNQTIQLLQSYRKEMNEAVDGYLSEHLEKFELGFRTMDQAILDGDVNGYIKGNNQIQEMLGYNVQFKNEEEFEDLMNSDEAFVL